MNSGLPLQGCQYYGSKIQPIFPFNHRPPSCRYNNYYIVLDMLSVVILSILLISVTYLHTDIRCDYKHYKFKIVYQRWDTTVHRRIKQTSQ